MNRLRRHMTAGVLALAAAAIAIALAGCGRGAKANEPVKLVFWQAWGGYEGKFLESLVAEFNRTHPHIRVESSMYNIGDKLMASIAGGVPPDVATVWDFMLATMGESGCFLPLDERLAASGLSEPDYLPHTFEYGMTKGRRWGVPTTLNVYGIYMNRERVRAAGLDPEKPPRSIAELNEWSRKLTIRDASGNLKQMGFLPVTHPIWFWNFGGDLNDRATGRFTLDKPDNIRAMEWMTAMYKETGLDAFRRFSAGFGKLESPQNPMFVGKRGLQEDGQWLIQMINKHAPGLDYDVFPFPPEKEGGPSYTQVSGSFWIIPTGTRHPEEAWEFLRWLIAPEQSARFCAELYNIPPLRAAIEQPVFKKLRSNPKFEFFVRQVIDGKARSQVLTPVSYQFNEDLTQGSDFVYSGKNQPAKFLKDLNTKMNHELDRANRMLGIGDGK